MSETSNEDYGSGQSSVEDNSNGQRGYAEALVEWRLSDQVENGSPLTSPPYWDIDEFGSKHSELYGTHTWKIEKYSEINKHRLCSDVFHVGGYAWYILIYPEQCDVYNHLSLHLCVANHEKLRPGWSDFVQFTIVLVNKDPKKSIYADTVNRFSNMDNVVRKKETIMADNWGWKKFIELPKLQEGYIDDLDSLIIKAQVQVIRERVDRPFRCLSSQYRRELVRVFLPNVEDIFLRFIEGERIKFNNLIQDKKKWPRLSAFWLRLDQTTRRKMCQDKMDVVLNLAAKLFFILKQGTSTLVMDSLYSGWKAIEGQTKKKKSRQRLMDNVEFPDGPAPIVSVDQDMFVLEDDLLLHDDLLLLIRRTVMAPFPIKEGKGSQNPSKVENVGEEYSKEAIMRDESRLTEIGRRALEILVLAHIYSNKIDVAYQEHMSLILQEELIREEEEECLVERKHKAKRGTIEKERKSKKKQAKQKKNKKEKRKEEKVRSQRDVEKEKSVRVKTESSADTLGDSSDVFDSVDSPADVLQLDSEDRKSSPILCELDDASEIHHPPSGNTSRGRSSSISKPSGGNSISLPDGVAERNVLNFQRKNWHREGKTKPRKVSGCNSLSLETVDQPSRHASNPKSQSHSSETSKVGEADVVISRIQDAHNPREHNPFSKDHGTVQTQEKNHDVFSPPKASPWNLPSVIQAKPEKRDVFNVDTIPNKRPISARSPLSDQASPSRDIQFQPASSIILPKLAAPVVSAAGTSTTSFSRAVSSTVRVSSPTYCQTYIPQSYKHAVVASLSYDHSTSQSTGKNALLSVSNQSGFPVNVGSTDASSGGLLRTGGSSSNRDPTATTISRNHIMNAYNTPVSSRMRQNAVQIMRPEQSLMTDEFPHLDMINDLLEEEHRLMDTSGYRLPQWLNNVYSFLANWGIYGRSRSYSDDGFYLSFSDYMSGSSSFFSSSPYGNRQMNELTQQMQRQTANMELSLLAMRRQNNAAAATYPHLDSSDPNMSTRINGYRDFMPWNGH